MRLFLYHWLFEQYKACPGVLHAYAKGIVQVFVRAEGADTGG